MTTRHLTAEDVLAKVCARLGYARADLKQAELRGYNADVALGRVLALAGVVAACDPALQGDDEFVRRMCDVADVDVAD